MKKQPLKLESGSFVKDTLCQYFSDALYSLKTTEGTCSHQVEYPTN
ncbi:putative transposase [Yersinia similis]|nr:putative transposase [Yersinia similis]